MRDEVIEPMGDFFESAYTTGFERGYSHGLRDGYRIKTRPHILIRRTTLKEFMRKLDELILEQAIAQ